MYLLRACLGLAALAIMLLSAAGQSPVPTPPATSTPPATPTTPGTVIAPGTPTPTPTPNPYPTYAVGHIMAIQKPSFSVAKILPERARNHLFTILKFFKHLDDEINSNIKKKNEGITDAGKVETQTCNMQDAKWGKKAAGHLDVRGLPKCDIKCNTEREFTSNVNSIVRAVRPALREWAKFVNDNARTIALAADMNWKNPAAGVGRFIYPDREAQNCTLWHTAAVRFENNWYLQTRVTSKASGPKASNSESEFVIQYVRLNPDKSAAAPLQLSVPRTETADIFVNATATRELWPRPGPDSVGLRRDISLNLAFKSAIATGDNENQQANDAVQASNIAILFLPLAMNLVPVALIADVNTLGMLMYTALTDVLTTIPLGIKGVELISIAGGRFKAVSTQLAGKAGRNETAFAELWVAECRLSDHLRFYRLGVIFVSVAVVLMVFGVSCEVIARAWVRRRRLQADPSLLSQEHAHGATHQPFTAAALTLQNRVVGGPATRSASPTHYAQAYPGSSASHAARSPGIGLMPHQRASAVQPDYGGISAGRPPVHTHGENCRCACHTAGHPHGRAHEYDARPYPDVLARKYH